MKLALLRWRCSWRRSDSNGWRDPRTRAREVAARKMRRDDYRSLRVR